jgi:hypothetical protein
MIIKILIALAVLVVVLIIFIATRPSDFRVTRTATIPAPAAIVFGQVNDLHKFQDWSPWAKIDPQCKVTYDGPPAGVSASFAWAGNKQVGEGRMTVIESRPGELVRFKLEFLKPFKATNTAEFNFKSTGNQTEVTWSMSGKNNFVFKAVGLFMNCDKMVGPDFEKGLVNLKSVVETRSTIKK